jgi:hypothetical protein
MNNRERIKTAIIYKEGSTRTEIAAVASRLDVLNVDGVYDSPKAYQESRERKRNEEAPQIVFVGESDAPSMSLALQYERNVNMFVVTNPLRHSAEELKRDLRLRANVASLPQYHSFVRTREQMLTEDDPEGLTRDPRNVLSEGLLKRKISELARGRKIERKIKVGLFGLGKFGNRVVQEIVSEHWLSELVVGSNYLAGMSEREMAKLSCKVLTNEVIGGEKIRPVNSIDALIAEDVDVLLSTEGPSKAIYGLTREQYTEKNLPLTWAKNEPLVKAFARNPRGLLVMLSHPPGPCADLATIKYGIPAGHITSFPIDMYRAQQKTFLRLGEKSTSRLVEKEDMPLDVIGGHGEDSTIIWRNQRLPRYLGEDIFSPLAESEKEEITAQVRDEGRIVMENSIESGIDYVGAPRIVAECLDMIAHYGTQPHFSWYSRFPAQRIASILGMKTYSGMKDMHLMFPVVIENAPLRVKLDKSFDIAALPPSIIDKLKRTITTQQRRVSELLTK